MNNGEQKGITLYPERTIKELGDLFGLFFEDINHAADGGLYAELLQNRSFEFCEIDNAGYHALTAWGKSDTLQWEVKDTQGACENNPHTLWVTAAPNAFFYNTGFGEGIYCEEEKEYLVTLRAKSLGQDVALCIGLADFSKTTDKTTNKTTDETVDETAAALLSDEVQMTIPGKPETKEQEHNGYHIYKGRIRARKTADGACLRIRLPEGGSVSFDTISLFPVETYKGRENGLRKDLATALEVMKPRFLRFPGGCLVHDGSLDSKARNSLYRWKNTIGPLYDRPARRNNWGYNQTLGLGYYEYFLLCEDIQAQPLPVLPAGFNPHKGEGCDLSQIGEWVQEALDLIEFANADESTTWGRIRAELGHPKPFGLKYLAIGNEEIGEGFFERYPYFHQAIREKYPEIQIINSAGPFPVGEGYEAGWESARKHGSDLVDEHYYSNPEWFIANMHHYDALDAKGPGVFLGEYASWGNTYENALVEAAYMTHLEKAAAVKLACYAPLFCNISYKNWTPDMIFFNEEKRLLTANYYVQKMFMEHQGEFEIDAVGTNLGQRQAYPGPKQLDGVFSIAGNSIEGRIEKLTIRDGENQTIYSLDSLEITDSKEQEIFNIPKTDYVIEFEFQRSKGRKGLYIHLANHLVVWEFGGWDNWDCNIQYLRRGRGATISHAIFHVEDIRYRLRIEVEGSSVTTYINGKKWNSVMIPQPELEELYYCASVDQNGDTILKVVNLTEDEKKVTVDIKGGKENYRIAQITELSGNSPTDENTFEQPDTVCPVQRVESVTSNAITHVFPKQSVTVMVLKR